MVSGLTDLGGFSLTLKVILFVGPHRPAGSDPFNSFCSASLSSRGSEDKTGFTDQPGSFLCRRSATRRMFVNAACTDDDVHERVCENSRM